jgi:iron-sulfur cluster repair protein YtfE (RIC family)
MINKTTTIEDLIEEIPGAITYLMEQKIRCIRCGEPIWGTLEEAAKEKDYSDDQIDVFVKELNQLKG